MNKHIASSSTQSATSVVLSDATPALPSAESNTTSVPPSSAETNITAVSPSEISKTNDLPALPDEPNQPPDNFSLPT